MYIKTDRFAWYRRTFPSNHACPAPDESSLNNRKLDLDYLIQTTDLRKYLPRSSCTALRQVNRSIRALLPASASMHEIHRSVLKNALPWDLLAHDELAVGESTVLRNIMAQPIDRTVKLQLAKSVRFLWDPECWNELRQLVPGIDRKALLELREALIQEPTFAQAQNKYNSIRHTDRSLQAQLCGLLPDCLLPPRTIASTPEPWLETTYLIDSKAKDFVEFRQLADGRHVLLESGRILICKEMPGPRDIPTEITISKGSHGHIGRHQIITYNSRENTAKVWREQPAQSGQWQAHTFLKGCSHSITQVAELKDGRVITLSSTGGTIRVWKHSGDSDVLKIRDRYPETMIVVPGDTIVVGYGVRSGDLMNMEVKIWTEQSNGWQVNSIGKPFNIGRNLRLIGATIFAVIEGSYPKERSTIFSNESGQWKQTTTFFGTAVEELPNQDILYYVEPQGRGKSPYREFFVHKKSSSKKLYTYLQADNVSTFPDGSLIANWGYIRDGRSFKNSRILYKVDKTLLVLSNGHLACTRVHEKGLWLLSPPSVPPVNASAYI